MLDMETTTEERTLTANDRCDKCRQQAYFIAVFDFGVLHFCRRCFLKNEEALRATTYYIHDESDALNK